MKPLNRACILDPYLAKSRAEKVLSSGSGFFDRAFEGPRCGNLYLLVSQGASRSTWSTGL